MHAFIKYQDQFQGLLQTRDLEVLGHPFLGNLSLGLASLCHRFAGFKLALDNERSESVVQKVSFWLELSECIFQLVGENQL